MPNDTFRIEQDSMGDVRVPREALWGAQTQRALENFPISGFRFPRRFLQAMGRIKQAAAAANLRLELLDRTRSDAIQRACDEVIRGELDDEFPLDIFQTGSGTSTNMNANEVISNRAIQLLGGRVGSRKPVHPNDHVNLGQSSNDVIPTALHVAAVTALAEDLDPALAELEESLRERARALSGIVKSGRTHLQDATPIRLDQELTGYATQVAKGRRRLEQAADSLREVALGGTAVGSGLNRHPDFPEIALEILSEGMDRPFRAAEDPFEANAARDDAVAASGALRTLAVSLAKIAGDLRWLGSGPRAGLGELRLPEVQPGSSIMPGKVNPVIAEALEQVAAQVTANDLAVTLGGRGGRLELNHMQPLIAHNLLQSIELLSRGVRVFTERLVRGLEADRDACRRSVERSLALATALAPRFGYDRAAAIAKQAHETGRSIRQVAEEETELNAEELDRLLDPMRMTEPGFL